METCLATYGTGPVDGFSDGDGMVQGGVGN